MYEFKKKMAPETLAAFELFERTFDKWTQLTGSREPCCEKHEQQRIKTASMVLLTIRNLLLKTLIEKGSQKELMDFCSEMITSYSQEIALLEKQDEFLRVIDSAGVYLQPLADA